MLKREQLEGSRYWFNKLDKRIEGSNIRERTLQIQVETFFRDRSARSVSYNDLWLTLGVLRYFRLSKGEVGTADEFLGDRGSDSPDKVQHSSICL